MLHLPILGRMRKACHTIISRLYEVDEADSQDAADSLRTLISELLTAPVCFDETLVESVSFLGEPEAVENKWGKDVRDAYDAAYRAAYELMGLENPARSQIREIIGQLRREGWRWRIYCHNRARIHFESIFRDCPLPTDSFLHSVRDYREVEPFDVLIKIGPLRSRGWGAAPDAILSAPRFGRLAQFVWSGCVDEDNFGYDPIIVRTGVGSQETMSTENQVGVRPAINWNQTIIQIGDSSGGSFDNSVPDELAIFGQLQRSSEMRRATLVQIDDDNGIFYPPHSQVPAFDPITTAPDPLGFKSPSETLTEGMYLIWPILGTADLGGLHSGEGRYSGIWKERLRKEHQSAPEDLVRRLREGGIHLRNLHSRIRQWYRPSSTVIHAPQTKRHFEILIKILGIERDVRASSSRTLHRPWSEYAWNEIGRTRGEAIQTGRQENEIVYEGCLRYFRVSSLIFRSVLKLRSSFS